MASGAKEQTTAVKKAVGAITNISDNMSQVAGSATEAAQLAKHAADIATADANTSMQARTATEKIKDATVNAVTKIEQLEARSIEISKIVAVIDNIAAQTNLLALNAAIEAARAGDQGKGFAVVSDEVRKLAERTAEATKEIAGLIDSVQKGINESSQVMQQVKTRADESSSFGKTANLALQEIIKESCEVNTQVARISSRLNTVSSSTSDLAKVFESVGAIVEQNMLGVEQMTANTSQVSKAVETVAGIAEENSAATEQVSASAQEMNAQGQEIVASAQTLKDMAVTLEQSVSMFILNAENENNDIKKK